MEWPFKYHSKGRPVKRIVLAHHVGNLLLSSVLVLLFSRVLLEVQGDSSPPVADVEDLFKDEGFLRMSRGGEAFGGRRPPPPIINPAHLSTPAPPRPFLSPSPPPVPKERLKPFVPHRKVESDSGGEDDKGSRDIVNSGRRQEEPNGGGRESGAHGGSSSGHGEVSKPLEKDVSAVFFKVGPGSEGSGPVTDSESHPLLGITPAAPGDPFDFNPILSNPAVTRILAGSSGRIPQWEPTLPDLHDLIPEGNYSGDTNNNRVYGGGLSNNLNGGQSPGNPPNGNGPLQPNPKNPVFVPSPVSSISRGSPTMYNMDQMTNNIAIPKHTLPNPSNLATSRTTLMSEEGGGVGGEAYGDNGRGGDDNRDLEMGSNGANTGTKRPNTQENRRDGLNLYDDDDSGMNENPYKNYMGSNGGEVQGKRGLGKEVGQNGQTDSEARDETGTKASICDALCGAWRHQCKLMGILFSITSVLCFLFALVVLYSLHFGLRDFVPFSIILLLLLTTSASRAIILLSGWYCPFSPDPQPDWFPIATTLPSALFTVAILVALRLARFPFPFIRSYTISVQMIVILSLVALLPPLALSLGATFYKPSSGILSQVAWIVGHVVLATVAAAYLFRFKLFYVRLGNERGSGICNGSSNTYTTGPHGSSHCGPTMAFGNGNNNMSSGLKKRPFVAKWGCLQARAMFGAALLVLSLCIIVIISVSLNGGSECSTWPGWVLSLCARILELAVVILLLLVTISSADVRFFHLSRGSVNKMGNGGLVNADLFPTMVSSNTAVQRCIPTYSSNTRADVVMLGGTENRSSLRGKTFGERALPGERVGEYRSSVGRGLPLRLGSGPSHSMPGTPLDGFPQGLRLPEPAPASLLVTKVVFGTPAVSREVNLNHQHDNPLLCTGGPSSSRDETSNIYASLESVKVASMPNAGSSNGSNHSGSDRVLLSAPRDYVYSISRDLTKTIDSIYDTSRTRGNGPHGIDGMAIPSLAHTIEQIGSIPNLNGTLGSRSSHFNPHSQNVHNSNGNVSLTRAELARTIERLRHGAATVPNSTIVTPTSSQSARNFVLQLGGPNHLPGILNPPPYYSSESSHDVTPDSGIVSDIHSKSTRAEVPDVAYTREYGRNSIEDVRRLPLLPMPNKQRTPSSTPLYDRTPTSPSNPSLASSPAVYHPCTTPIYIPPTPGNSVVGRVEHLLNQTEHILSRTESLDTNTQSTGLQRLLSHKEQLEHVEKLLAQAEYAIWVEKRNCAQQVSQLSPSDSQQSQQNYPHRSGQGVPNGNSPYPAANSPAFPSSHTNSANGATQTQRSNANHGSNSSSNSTKNTNSNNSSGPDHHHHHRNSHQSKKLSKNLEEESVV